MVAAGRVDRLGWHGAAALNRHGAAARRTRNPLAAWFLNLSLSASGISSASLLAPLGGVGPGCSAISFAQLDRMANRLDVWVVGRERLERWLAGGSRTQPPARSLLARGRSTACRGAEAEARATSTLSASTAGFISVADDSHRWCEPPGVRDSTRSVVPRLGTHSHPRGRLFADTVARTICSRERVTWINRGPSSSPRSSPRR